METLKEVKQSFAEELYSGADDLDFIPGVLSEMKNDYVKELENVSPEGEQENLMWEAGYIRGYEVALYVLKYSLETTDEFKSINDVKQTLNYLLTN